MSSSQFVVRGQELVDRQQYQEAVKVCRLGLLASPTEVAGRLVLARALLALRRYDEVLAEMRVALELESTTPGAHVLKGEALLRKGEVLQARESLERAAQLEPGNPRVGALLRECSDALGASGSPRPRAVSTSFLDDPLESHTKHYPAHAGAAALSTGAASTITRPHNDPAPPPQNETSGTIELDPELEGVEILPTDPAAAAAAAARVEHSQPISLDTGDVELLEGSDVALLPDEPTRVDAPMDTPPEDQSTRHYGKPVDPTRAGKRAASVSMDPQLAASAARVDELFADDPDDGVSKVQLVPGGRAVPSFGPPESSMPSLARGAARTGPLRETESVAGRPPRSRTEDMRLIKAGLGIDDTGRRSSVRRASKQRPTVATATPDTQRRPPSKRERTEMVKTPRPHRARPAPRKRGRLVALYGAIAAVVVAGAIVAGLEVRNARLERQVERAARDARALAAEDSYRGYLRAAEAYARILGVRDDGATRAALARFEAATAAEFGDRAERARELVGGLGSDRRPDALAARAYLALAEHDEAGARDASAALVAAAPDDPTGHYLVGRAALLSGDPATAVDALRAALGKKPAPAPYVWLGVAEAELGRYPEALAAIDAALALVPKHPAATIERARVLAASGGLPPPGEPETELRAVIEEGRRPIGEQSLGVAREQVGWAALALAEVALARGDQVAARAAVDEAVTSRPVDDWRFVDALIGAYLRLGDLERADSEATAGAKRWPDRARARVAEVALARGQPDKALEALAEFPGIEQHPVALALRGRAKLALNDHDGAAEDLDEALAARPAMRAAQVARAEVDLHRGDARAAVARLKPLYDESASPEIGVVYASALRASGERERARVVLEDSLESPYRGRAYLELARLDRDEGNFRAARQSYAKAIEANPDGVDARLEAALLALEVGDPTGAHEALEALVKDYPQNGRALVAAARVRTLRGDLDGADELLVRADAEPTAPRWQVSRERGRLAMRRGRPKVAVEELERGVTLQPDDPEMRLLLIDAYLTGEDAPGASRALTDVLKRFADQPVSDLARGRVHFFNERPRDAMTAFRDAERKLIKNKATPRWLGQAHYWKGRVAYWDGDLRGAGESLREAVRLDPGNADAYFFLGQVEYERDNLKGAAAAYEKSIEADPGSNAEAWFYLGETSFKLRRGKMARRGLERYIEMAPAGELVNDAKAMLAKL